MHVVGPGPYLELLNGEPCAWNRLCALFSPEN